MTATIILDGAMVSALVTKVNHYFGQMRLCGTRWTITLPTRELG